MDTSVYDRMVLIRGDITTEKVDAIVNAANSTLLGGGGVDGAIHRAAGPELLAECRTLGGCPTGQARITRGYRLPARHVIHTVGPVYHGGRKGEPELLADCYRNSLKLAADNNLETVAFPAISCGVYGYPIEEASRIAIRTAAEFLAKHPRIKQVRFVLFGQGDYGVYERTLTEMKNEA
jgi:O-acetyl-ADP-ribose deacetylase (regulator of RNase III)